MGSGLSSDLTANKVFPRGQTVPTSDIARGNGDGPVSFCTTDSLRRTEQFWVTHQQKKHDLAQDIKLSNSSPGRSTEGTKSSSVVHAKSAVILTQA